MIRFESVKLDNLYNEGVQITPTIVFAFTQICRSGLLKVTKEYTITYDKSSELWSGEVIDCDGWRDLNQDEVMDIVKQKKLEGMV